MLENFAEVIKPGSREAVLLAGIDPARLPRHVAVIMDGNGRWAKRQGNRAFSVIAQVQRRCVRSSTRRRGWN